MYKSMLIYFVFGAYVKSGYKHEFYTSDAAMMKDFYWDHHDLPLPLINKSVW